jgi:hypothetical protein
MTFCEELIVYFPLNTFQFSKLLLTLASTVILGSESHGTHDHNTTP